MTPRDRPRLTLAELLTVPIYVAAAMLCIAPATRPTVLREYGIAQLVLVEAIIVPLAMSVVAQVLVRRGRRRERVVAAFLGISAVSGVVALIAMVALNLWDVGRAVVVGRGLPVHLVAFTIALTGGLVALFAAIRSLLPRIVPGRCPNCGQKALFPDRASTIVPGRSSGTSFACDSCGARARGRPGGGFRIAEEGPERPASRLPATVA